MNAPEALKELLAVHAQGKELPHESAVLHVTGEAVYTDDIPELRGTLYAALYGLLISEDSAMVLGAGMLFLVLAAIMVVTRKVDWYAVGAYMSEAPARHRARPATQDALCPPLRWASCVSMTSS